MKLKTFIEAWLVNLAYFATWYLGAAYINWDLAWFRPWQWNNDLRAVGLIMGAAVLVLVQSAYWMIWKKRDL